MESEGIAHSEEGGGGRRPHRGRRWLRVVAVAVVIAVTVAAGGVLAARRWLVENPVAGTTPPAATGLTADERAYYDYVGPRLHSLVAQTQQLAALGARKSRNVFTLENGYNQTNALIDQIDTYDRAHGVPARFISAHTSYTTGAARVKQTMQDAESAFLHGQWDRLQPLLATFGQATALLVQAMNALDAAGGSLPATPGT